MNKDKDSRTAGRVKKFIVDVTYRNQSNALEFVETEILEAISRQDAIYAVRSMVETPSFLEENVYICAKAKVKKVSRAQEENREAIRQLEEKMKEKEPPVTVTFKLRKDRNWDEYIVEVGENGVLNEARAYHTDDKEDAKATMQAMKEEEERHPTTIEKLKERMQETIKAAALKETVKESYLKDADCMRLIEEHIFWSTLAKKSPKDFRLQQAAEAAYEDVAEYIHEMML